MQPRIADPNFHFDFAGLRTGSASYEEGPTGCTVFAFPRAWMTSADVRGGSPGTVLADEFGQLCGICFAGGSLLGLEATAGVARAMFMERGHDEVRWEDIRPVGGAIVFDFARNNGVYPDRELGEAAYRAASEGGFAIGAHGAGRNVRVGKALAGLESETGGQGAAMRQQAEVKVLAFTVVNALGAILDRDGKVVRGHLDAATGRRLTPAEALSHTPAPPSQGRNTTLTLIATNQRLAPGDLRQFARQVHASMARAIQPFHTRFDGDVLFAVSSGEVSNTRFADVSVLGALAAETAWDAVLAAVR